MCIRGQDDDEMLLHFQQIKMSAIEMFNAGQTHSHIEHMPCIVEYLIGWRRANKKPESKEIYETNNE